MGHSEQYKVARLEQTVVEEIRRFEQKLEMQAGFPITLVAYTNDQEHKENPETAIE